ncbi:hypothetical protein AB0M95_39980 [Sphaerisporangium sp. NPDC051017]|uniref:hypothetical protein n=1 Tax=Sphaerisporangium sp. NPDC051017 TaxID=3154636 RepID=UPI00343F8F66
MVWTCVLDWTSTYGDLEPPICVVQADSLDSAIDLAFSLVSEHFTRVAEWPAPDDVAEHLLSIATFHGDLSTAIASEGHYILLATDL